MSHIIEAESVAAVLHNLRNRGALSVTETERLLRYVEQREKMAKEYYALTSILNKHVQPLIEDLQNARLVGKVTIRQRLPERMECDDDDYDEWLSGMGLYDDEEEEQEEIEECEDIDDEEDDDDESSLAYMERAIARSEAERTHLARIDALLPPVTSLEDIDEAYRQVGYAEGVGHAIHRYLRRRVEELERELALRDGTRPDASLKSASVP